MSLDPPLDILKVLARRVIDEQLFSATNVIRGPDPEEGDHEPTKSCSIPIPYSTNMVTILPNKAIPPCVKVTRAFAMGRTVAGYICCTFLASKLL